MLGFLTKRGTFLIASIAMVLSACNTFTDLRPVPDIYANSESIADKALVTIKAFGAAQDTIIAVCDPVLQGAASEEVCGPLIIAEQTLRPAVKATGLVAAEYADIDARIDELGPEAPAEWLALAAVTAGRLAEAIGPIRAEIDMFVNKAGALTDG